MTNTACCSNRCKINKSDKGQKNKCNTVFKQRGAAQMYGEQQEQRSNKRRKTKAKTTVGKQGSSGKQSANVGILEANKWGDMLGDKRGDKEAVANKAQRRQAGRQTKCKSQKQTRREASGRHVRKQGGSSGSVGPKKHQSATQSLRSGGHLARARRPNTLRGLGAVWGRKETRVTGEQPEYKC